MTIAKTPGGTRGARVPPRRLIKILVPLMARSHRRKGDTFQGNELLYLTTIGAKSGETRNHPVARFDDGEGGWWIVASLGGAAHHPAWYHNIAAHPDRVSVEVAGSHYQVSAQQLSGADYDNAWAQITSRSPGFLEYAKKTDRHLPVLRLTITA